MIQSNLVSDNQLGYLIPGRRVAFFFEYEWFFNGSNDPNTMKKRAAIVELNNCAAVLRKISFKNGQVIGEMETLSGFII